MSALFASAGNFNQNINTETNGDGTKSWNVESVTNMSWLFSGAKIFNQNLSGWVVSSVNNMAGMFNMAEGFNGDLSLWDVSGVTDMSIMF